MIDFEVWPGPMEGIGKGGFVNAVNHLELVDRWMTPFFRLSQELPRRSKMASFISVFQPDKIPVCVQLMGVDPVLLGEAAVCFAELGATEINLNFGCPSSRVVSGGAGGGALKSPDKLADFCRIVRKQLPQQLPLSVKLRSGWEKSEEMEFLLPSLAESGAVNKIFFHYRTVREQYLPIDESERMRRFQRAVELLEQIPLVLNGDIADVASGIEIVERFKCAGIMIARPWLRDPWLLRRFKHRECPDAESGREIFFAEAAACDVPQGGMIELAKMLWGVNDPHFKKVLDAH